MIAAITFESASLWPLVAAGVGALTLAVAWFYPGQIRASGAGRWMPPILRWVALTALAVSFLKPVFLQPRSAEQAGAVVVLLDCSKSMSVVDPGRTPAEQVALAGGLGRISPGVRSNVVASLSDDLDRIESRARDAFSARSDLDYARVSGRGIAEKQQKLQEVMGRYVEAAHTLAGRAGTFPKGADLRSRLNDLEPVPDAAAADWADEVRRRIDRVRGAARAFQSAADEQLYNSDPAVRLACDRLARSSRLDLAEAALLDPVKGLVARLGSRDPVIGLAIDRGLSPLVLSRSGHPVSELSLSATANDSDLAGAVSAALGALNKQPIRAVVLLSDGRQVGGRGDVTSALRPSGVPVFTVGIAPERVPDVCVSKVSLSASSAFAGEVIDGEADVIDDGGIKSPTELHVSSSTGQSVERLAPRTRRDPREHGREWGARFAVAVNPKDGAAERLVFSVPPVAGEATTANNRVERWVKVSASRLNVAVVTAAPNWDFQYLRASMARRTWVRLASEVLTPERPRLLLTPAQILDQDVLVLSDVPETALDVNQWDAVRALLADRGGSVIVVAGNAFDVANYAHQPIARTLLPFHDVRPIWKEWPGEQPAFHFVPTPSGERELLRLGNDADDVRQWQELPGVFRFLQIPDKSLYPDVLPLLLESEGGGVVLTERRLGAGRVLFLGLNETWRWRLKGAEREADRIWRQLIRHAGGEPYAVTRGNLALDVDKVAIRPGEALHVGVRLRTGGAETQSSCAIQILRGGKQVSTRRLASSGGGRFAGQIADLPEGDYQIQLRGAASDGAGEVHVSIHVADSDEAEMRDVSGDRNMLTRIARSSGGQYLPIEQVDRLPDRLNALHDTESQFVRHPIWNSPLLFAFVLACFAGEWALRKRFGLA